ncbi:hypothetical protein ACFFKU_18205 [Kineococcus gynurae]|uniref:Glycosyltransferase involved in cell wall biosynthesis n=1 Tax=Kineococcus gynurae TaxID=452979 RepID=A0ABV5LNC2_9ACTN
MIRTRSTLLAVGDPRHGVTAAALAQAEAHDVVLRGGIELLDADLGSGPVHVHVTDRLFGDGPEDAADRLVALARRVPLLVTLHDLPQPSDGERNFPRRRLAYSRVADAARHVVVSSRHERGLLTTSSPVTVVPLPVPTLRPDRATAPVDPGARPTAVAVLGYLYPGKGHVPTLAAMSGLPADVGLVALGRTSPGHEDLAEALAARAAELGRRFTVTGYLEDDVLLGRLRSPVIPVAAHEHLSASGSIGTWVAAGRRPIVPPSPWAEEFEERNPGSLLLTSDLRGALAEAFADPARTFADPGRRGAPDLAETVLAVRDLLRRIEVRG